MGVLPWSKGNSLRNFVDLINEATFKWANWDAPKVLQIGDFGVIDKKTGKLKVEGNTYYVSLTITERSYKYSL